MDDGVINLTVAVRPVDPVRYMKVTYRLMWWEVANNNRRKMHGMPLLRRVHLRKVTPKARHRIIQEDMKIE